MYDIYYNYIKQKYDHQAKGLFKDKDHLTFENLTNNADENIHKGKEKLDFSN